MSYLLDGDAYDLKLYTTNYLINNVGARQRHSRK